MSTHEVLLDVNDKARETEQATAPQISTVNEILTGVVGKYLKSILFTI